MSNDFTSMLPINTLAKRLGCSKETISTYIKHGAFPSMFEINGIYYVKESDVVAAEQCISETLDCVSLSTAAKALQTSRVTLANLIKNGDIPYLVDLRGKTVISKSIIPDLGQRLALNVDISDCVNLSTARRIIQAAGYICSKEKLLELANKGKLFLARRNGMVWFRLTEIENLISSFSLEGFWTLKETSIFLNRSLASVNHLVRIKKAFPGARRWAYDRKVTIIPIEEIKKYAAIQDLLSLKNLEDPYQLFDHLTIDLDSSGKENTLQKYRDYAYEEINKSKMTKKTCLSRTLANTARMFFPMLTRELNFYSNSEIKDIVNKPELTGYASRYYIKFLDYCKLTDSSFDYDGALKVINNKNKAPIEIEKEYTPEEYAQILLWSMNMNTHIPNALHNETYARHWLYLLLNTTNAWRRADFTKIASVSPALIGVPNLEWFQTNRLSLDQAQRIILQFSRSTEILRAGKTNAFLRFYCPFDMMEVVATALVIAEFHRQNLGKDKILPLAPQKLIKNLRKEIPYFSNRRMTNAIMTYINENSEFLGSGLILATIVRSHFLPDSSLVYLKTSNKDGPVSEVVPIITRRGGLHGWMWNKLIDLIFVKTELVPQGKEEKTVMIEQLRKSMKPLEAEWAAGIVLSQRQRYQSVAMQLASRPKEELIAIITALFQGKMPARIPNAQCLCYPKCTVPYGDANSCLYCEWIIPMQYLLISAAEELSFILKSLKGISQCNRIERIRLTAQFVKVMEIVKQAESHFGPKYVDIFIDRTALKNIINEVVTKFLECKMEKEHK